MKLILLTGDECGICHEAEAKFREQFKQEIANGEAKVVNLDQDEQAQKMWLENDLPLAPAVVLVTQDNKVISHIDPDDLLSDKPKALAAAAEAEKAPIESSGIPNP